MDLETAINVLESEEGMLDKTTGVGEAWELIKSYLKIESRVTRSRESKLCLRIVALRETLMFIQTMEGPAKHIAGNALIVDNERNK